MTEQGRRVSILGMPTSAGSHNPGQEKAPAAWRAAGLVDGLRRAGLDVEDRGDLPAAPFRPVPPVDGLRDVERVVAVAQQVAGEVAAIRADRRLPLVLGGDCTITLGVLAGFGEAGLVYFDGDADLTTPERSESAVADTMGMTHMLGGGSPRLAGLGSLVITEANPDHDPDGQLIRTLVQVVTGALAGAERLGAPGRPDQ
jgi:arginase